MKDIEKTYALINEALNMMNTCLKVVLHETEKLNAANHEAVEELRRKSIPTPSQIIEGGK